MQKVEFQVGAKAARLIGRENIADVDGALIELIKNSYDADATCVYVDFYMPFPDVPDKTDVTHFTEYLSEKELQFVRECYDIKGNAWTKKQNLPNKIQDELKDILFAHNRIIVADNGTGMTEDVVRSAWMYIGTSNKENNIMSAKGRVKTGAKGIGRFALDKLSMNSVMYTKAISSAETVRWDMNWEQFAEATLISDVKADLETEYTEYKSIVKDILGEDNALLNEHDWTTGTMIILSPIREAWSERLFRKVNTNLKSINPIGSADRFEVIVKNVLLPKFSFKTEKVAIDKDDYDYRIYAEYDGGELLKIRLLRNEIDLSVKKVTVEKYGSSITKSVDEFWSGERMQKRHYQKLDYANELVIEKKVTDILPSDTLEKIQKVGPFTAEMYFLRNANNEYAIMKKVAVRKRKKLLEQFSGIKLYRDDFKVRPYGDDGAMYDWLGMGGRAQRSPAPVSHLTGAWRVQPYQMIGLVKIGRETNPNLEDMANREGLALTDTYYIFVSLLQECLKEFEFDRQYIYMEYSKWIRSIEDELSDYAEKVKEEAIRREVEHVKKAEEKEHDEKYRENNKITSGFTEDEMFGTVYKLMQESEKSLNSKQMLQILSASGILMNTFFHEFNAINTQFHVQASQIRSRVNYILKGQEYDGLPAYNPYNRIDSLEKNDMLIAAFLDVIMEGLKKDSLKQQEISLEKMIITILEKWEIILGKKHISISIKSPEEQSEDTVSIALVDMYIILNNFILNSAWFLEQTHNPERKILFDIEDAADRVILKMENNGPPLADMFRNNPDKIFEIGETSKKEKGTGLGLWIVRETVERNNGIISVVDKTDGFGLKIEFRKPERRV